MLRHAGRLGALTCRVHTPAGVGIPPRNDMTVWMSSLEAEDADRRRVDGDMPPLVDRQADPSGSQHTSEPAVREKRHAAAPRGAGAAMTRSARIGRIRGHLAARAAVGPHVPTRAQLVDLVRVLAFLGAVVLFGQIGVDLRDGAQACWRRTKTGVAH